MGKWAYLVSVNGLDLLLTKALGKTLQNSGPCHPSETMAQACHLG